MTTETQLLELWEHGYSATTLERALLLSIAANPGLTTDEILDMPVGLRDGRLMLLRSNLFGLRVTSITNCMKCNTQLELSFDLDPMIGLVHHYTTPSFPVAWQNSQLEVRRPNTRDIFNVAAAQHPAPSAMLLHSCIINGSLTLPDIQYTDSLQATIANSLEQNDPLGDIEFLMHCTECSHSFQSSFDIVSFLWCELDAWCQRLMSNVHLLARSYGWTETETLSLSPWRRQIYLNMIRQ